MNCIEAYREGKSRGFRIGMNVAVSREDRSNACCDCEPPALCEDCLLQAASECEMNDRDFSPFEFLAHDLNEHEAYSEARWEAFESGLAKGFRAAARRRLAQLTKAKG